MSSEYNSPNASCGVTSMKHWTVPQREMVARLGKLAFWKIAIKPGRPMAFGRIGNAWLFGPPGNPVAVMVSFCQIAIDGLLVYGGGTWKVTVTGNQGSGVLSSMAEADCFIVLAEACGDVAVGDLVDVQSFDGAI
jgi:molybdopterin molybdotransferase